jgi:hypothetical protein
VEAKAPPPGAHNRGTNYTSGLWGPPSDRRLNLPRFAPPVPRRARQNRSSGSPRPVAMGADCEDAVKQLSSLMEQVEAPLKRSFQNVHQGYPKETLMRFLKAREWNVSKAHKMVSFHTKFLNSG